MLKNLTGRALALYALAPQDGLPPSTLRPGEQPLCDLPASGPGVRVTLAFSPTGECRDGVPTTRPIPPTAEQIAAALPSPEEGVTLIVTAIVAPHAWAAGRTDVVHLGDAVLDAGQQVGVRGLVVAPPPYRPTPLGGLLEGQRLDEEDFAEARSAAATHFEIPVPGGVARMTPSEAIEGLRAVGRAFAGMGVVGPLDASPEAWGDAVRGVGAGARAFAEYEAARAARKA